jgi:hypothetical protein
MESLPMSMMRDKIHFSRKAMLTGRRTDITTRLWVIEGVHIQPPRTTVDHFIQSRTPLLPHPLTDL